MKKLEFLSISAISALLDGFRLLSHQFVFFIHELPDISKRDVPGLIKNAYALKHFEKALECFELSEMEFRLVTKLTIVPF